MSESLKEEFLHELLDRTFMLAGIFEDYVCNNSALAYYPELHEPVDEVRDKLWDLYQLLGAKLAEGE